MTAPDKYPVSLAPNQGWDKRILVCHCGTMVDAFIVVCQRYVILIDTMLNPKTASAMLDIANPYLSDGRQLLVVNTHADWDHCWGNQLFAGPTAIYHAPIIATRRCSERLHEGQAALTLGEMHTEEPGIYDDVILTPPTIMFEDELIIDGDDLTLHLFATPGHESDHCSIHIPEINTLLPGDAAEMPFPFAMSASALPQLRASLEKLIALQPAVALYCHAPVTAGPDLIRDNIAYFGRLEQHCREAIRTGVEPKAIDDANVEALVNFSFQEALPASATVGAIPDMYRNGHLAHIHMMLEYLRQLPSA